MKIPHNKSVKIEKVGYLKFYSDKIGILGLSKNFKYCSSTPNVILDGEGAKVLFHLGLGLLLGRLLEVENEEAK